MLVSVCICVRACVCICGGACVYVSVCECLCRACVYELARELVNE